MRILMLAPHPGIRTPLEKVVPALAEGLRGLGCEVSVAGWGRRREHEPISEKISGRIADIRRVRGILGAQRFDLLLVHTAHDWNTVSRDLALLTATRALCRHRVLHFHGSLVDRLHGPGRVLFKRASALLLRGCDAVLVLSSEEQRQWRTFAPAARVCVVKNPFVPPPGQAPAAARRHLGVPESVPILLFSGRLVETKGPFELLAILPALRARTPCHLLLVGEGPARPELERQAVAARLVEHVTLAGYLEGEGLRAAYAAADVFVLPSWTEGLPQSLLEAMDAGLPVVTTRMRGMADHLREDAHALLIPPRDSGALTAALERLLTDGELRARMGRANREKVREFAPEVVAPDYLAALRRVMDGAG